MLFRSHLILAILVSSFSVFQAQALIQVLDKAGIQTYLLTNSPATLTVHILRKSTAPNQVPAVIKSLNKTYADPMSGSQCQATVQVLEKSFVRHAIQNDSTSYGSLRIHVTHTCLSVIGKLIGVFSANPYVVFRIPNSTNPAVTISN